MPQRTDEAAMTEPNPASSDPLGDSFAERVYLMVKHCDENDPECACFHTGKGNGFIVKDAEKLRRVYLKMFKVCQPKDKDGIPQFDSFHRQLNKYAFAKHNKSKENEMLYRHRSDLFRKGDVRSLKLIKIAKKEDSSSDETDSVAENSQLMSELVAVKTKLQQVEEKMDSQHKEVVGLLNFIAGMRSSSHILSGTPFSHLSVEKPTFDPRLHVMKDDDRKPPKPSRTNTSILQGAPISLLINGSKRPRSDYTSFCDGSQSTNEARSVTDTATTTSTSTLTASTFGNDANHAAIKCIGEDEPTEIMDCDSPEPSRASPAAQDKPAPDVRQKDAQHDFDSIDIAWESDDDLFDSLTLQRLLNNDDSGSLLTNGTPSLTKPPPSVGAPAHFSVARQPTKGRKKKHKRSGGSSSSFASTISSLSNEGTVSSLRRGRSRSSVYLITARGNDVLVGNGDFSRHAGNQRHSSLVSDKRTSYLQATTDGKNKICATIVRCIKEQGGFFLEKASDYGSGNRGKACWRELDDESAMQFTVQAMLEDDTQDHSDLTSSSEDDEGQGGNGNGPEPDHADGDKDNNNSSGDDSPRGRSAGSGGGSTGFDKSGGGNDATGSTKVSLCTVPSTADPDNQELLAVGSTSTPDGLCSVPSIGDPDNQEFPAVAATSTPNEVDSGNQEHASQEDDLAYQDSEREPRPTSEDEELSTTVELRTDPELAQPVTSRPDITIVLGDGLLEEVLEETLREEGKRLSEDVLEERLREEGERNVSFSHISVRKYPMVLGDHPVCSSGPPVTLGWRFQAEAPVDIDEYESSRPERRNAWDMIMSSAYRMKVLTKEAGHTEWEIREAVRSMKEAKRQRQKSLRGLPFVQIQEAIQATEKKFRSLRINKSRRESSKSQRKDEEANRVALVSSDPSGIQHRDSVAILQSKVR